MRKVLLLSLVLLYTVSTWAAQRSPEGALTIAKSFFAQYPATRSADDVRLVAVSGDLLKSASTTRGLSAVSSFYVYNHGLSAYVIVSGDDRMKPVLGYSDSGAFVTDNLPLNILGWLEGYDAVYAALADGKQVIKEPMLLTRAAFSETVSPLLGNINWNQDAPYNNACPLVQVRKAIS
ncbi:Spi family protease inhibitor [Bacteroides timonensis]|uniref:Spi family protease inhibitor n=1 Tax=Bacteroides timonensis TaxID=1470345 RepID=UPI0004AE0D30|nr:Spi family protease inhibitor [Bacteroides timonensis]